MFTKKLGKQLPTLMIHTRQAYFVILFLQKYCAKEASRQQYQQHLAGHVPPNMPEKKSGYASSQGHRKIHHSSSISYTTSLYLSLEKKSAKKIPPLTVSLSVLQGSGFFCSGMYISSFESVLAWKNYKSFYQFLSLLAVIPAVEKFSFLSQLHNK